MLFLQYYEQMGKPTPKIEVMKFLKAKGYTDSKDYAGECEPVVIIAKGQSTIYLFFLFPFLVVVLQIRTICLKCLLH